MVSIFDTHAHYDSRQYDGDMDEVLNRIHGIGNEENTEGIIKVGRIINTGADTESSVKSVKIAEKYDFILAAVGVHPDSAGELIYSEDRKEEKEVCLNNREAIKKMCENPNVVAIGEIGLDYHWNVWPKDIQKEAFKLQWELALEKNLPVVIHSREAAEDTLNMIRSFYEKNDHKPLRADMHCYSYSLEHAQEYLKMGLMFGIGGVVTFKNARKLVEVVDMLPLDRILLETDAPYMAPDPFRGKRNDSGKLSLVAEKIAAIKGVSAERVYEQTWENAVRFFAL
ncbi:MAG: TatD family hydrolase [Lachnospiraceae bacterium]|nr:TatD family hydrolase [Lachnospiraceae bacterium]